MSREDVEEFAQQDMVVQSALLKIPSISAQNKGIEETKTYLMQKFKDLGAKKVEEWHEPGANPVVFAEFSGQADKTVLFYNHYDVQPPEPLEEWRTEPFEPTFADGYLYARGAGDDKGELMSRLSVVSYFQSHGGLPCNLKFFVEGGEEVGSPKVPDFVAHHKAALQTDVCVWEGGDKSSEENYDITTGVKGIVSFDLAVKTADVDIHSSLAAYVDNAAWRLVEALSSLKDSETGEVLVEGFYKDVEGLDESTQRVVETMDFDEETVRRTYGLRRPLVTNDPKYALVNAPTMTVNGLSSGYEGDGVKTIVPKEARAKLDCRLVPSQDPETIFHLVEAQLKKNGYGDVKATFNLGEDAFRSDINDPFVKACVQTAKQVYGQERAKLIPNSAGGGPEKPFFDNLQVPVVSIGVGYAKSGAHAPNENIRVKDYQEGVYYFTELFKNFAN
ncbi:M20/M25/M40 family metallo-hydrolase [Pediococcus siamensis]|uniref:M20/M25/M40 family metallo-hydrolase n=1 Tax=Pediococcus siamensis TaxID=381829 RepID=UPI0039A2C774